MHKNYIVIIIIIMIRSNLSKRFDWKLNQIGLNLKFFGEIIQRTNIKDLLSYSKYNQF